MSTASTENARVLQNPMHLNSIREVSRPDIKNNNSTSHNYSAWQVDLHVPVPQTAFISSVPHWLAFDFLHFFSLRVLASTTLWIASKFPRESQRGLIIWGVQLCSHPRPTRSLPTSHQLLERAVILWNIQARQKILCVVPGPLARVFHSLPIQLLQKGLLSEAVMQIAQVDERWLNLIVQRFLRRYSYEPLLGC